MKNDLITLAFIAIFASALMLPGLGRYMDMNLERRLEHELKMACINAGKTLIEGSCT